jgi:hypothetical protein
MEWILKLAGNTSVDVNYSYHSTNSTANGSSTTVGLVDQIQSGKGPTAASWGYCYRTATDTDKLASNRRYTWGPDLSGTAQGAGGVGGLLGVDSTASDGSQRLSLTCTEANGNIMALVDASSNQVIARFDYDPFGNTITRWQAPNTNADQLCSLVTFKLVFSSDWRSTDANDSTKTFGGVNIRGAIDQLQRRLFASPNLQDLPGVPSLQWNDSNPPRIPTEPMEVQFSSSF